MYYPFIPSLVDPCPNINFLLVFQTFYKKKIKNLKSNPKTNSYLIIPFKVKCVPVHFNNVLYGLNSCVPHKISPVRMTTLKNPALKGIFINTLHHNNLLYLCLKGRLLKWQIPKWAIFQGITYYLTYSVIDSFFTLKMTHQLWLDKLLHIQIQIILIGIKSNYISENYLP